MITLDLDIAIVGGGIAGLWLLARLRAQGYGALLVEGDRLGARQTICSQGIIHGGAKYALRGEVSGAARAVGAMPERWRRCLAGSGEVDLSRVRVLSAHQCLFTTESLGSRLAGFFASQLMRSRMERLPEHAFPAALCDPRFRGSVYRLDEPVLDVASLLQALADAGAEALVRNDGPMTPEPDGSLLLRAPDREPLRVRARCTVFTAGAGNGAVAPDAMQLRPLHMVMARGEALPGALYAHCLGAADTPRLTITAHRDADGRTVWYLGGQLAEAGLERSSGEQIAAAREELAAVLPWVDLAGARFATVRVERAEARAPGGGRPDTPGVVARENLIAAWPTKLALAPLLADQVLALLEREGIAPRGADLGPLADWPRPPVAAYPWDEAREWC